MNVDPTLSLPIRFDYYWNQARDWQTVLSTSLTSSHHHISEVCSGWSPKIPLALLDTEFTGRYTALDISEYALQKLESLCQAFGHDYQLKTKQLDVLHDQIPNSDVFLLNHVFDDILLFEFWPDQNLNPFSELPKLKAFWKKNRTAMLDKIPSLATMLVTQLVTVLAPEGLLIIHQYPGYQEQLYQMTEAIELSQVFFETCQKILLEEYNFQIQTVSLPPTTNQRFTTQNLAILKKGTAKTEHQKDSWTAQNQSIKTESTPPFETKYDVRVIASKCVGDGSCVAFAPNTFRINAQNIAEVIAMAGDDDQVKLLAAQVCPTKAIVVTDRETGKQVWPLLDE